MPRQRHRVLHRMNFESPYVNMPMRLTVRQNLNVFGMLYGCADIAGRIRELAEEHGYDLSASYAYSDSFTDLPMLELVGHPVAVNPDGELRAVATERGWPIRRRESP